MIVINVIAFAMYGIDKYRAMAGKWRIPEKTLIVFAAAGGCYGAWAGMQVFRHKTQKSKFTTLIPLFMVVYGALLVKVGFFK